jgi:hypothetical protein
MALVVGSGEGLSIMHYLLVAMALAVYVAAFVLAADGRFGLALALSVFASGTYWASRQRLRYP